MSPKPNTSITIKRVDQEPDCRVCEDKGSGQVCNPKQLTLKDANNASVEFTCPEPQGIFTVEINREIGMTITDFIECENVNISWVHH